MKSWTVFAEDQQEEKLKTKIDPWGTLGVTGNGFESKHLVKTILV